MTCGFDHRHKLLSEQKFNINPEGRKWGKQTLSYHFVDPISESHRKQIRRAFDEVEANAPFRFVRENALRDADLRIYHRKANNTWAGWATFPPRQPDGWSSISINMDATIVTSVGLFYRRLFLHELLHALGLDHSEWWRFWSIMHPRVGGLIASTADSWRGLRALYGED